MELNVDVKQMVERLNTRLGACPSCGQYPVDLAKVRDKAIKSGALSHLDSGVTVLYVLNRLPTAFIADDAVNEADGTIDCPDCGHTFEPQDKFY